MTGNRARKDFLRSRDWKRIERSLRDAVLDRISSPFAECGVSLINKYANVIRTN